MHSALFSVSLGMIEYDGRTMGWDFCPSFEDDGKLGRHFASK
jgi:hypothetical protein